jgi:phosphoglycerate dehydrogenase-like enzyme
MMFILMLARQYPVARTNLEKLELYGPMGLELEGCRLGIVGFGASGTELARRAKGHGMKISAIDVRDISPAEQSEYGLDLVGKPDALDALLPTLDVLSLHLHLNAETRHYLNAERLARMKPSAFVINVARGALVDEAALTEALQTKRLGGAGLDAFGTEPPDLSSPLFRMPNVIATPHIAGATDGTSRKRARCAADNADRVAAGLEPLYRVA